MDFTPEAENEVIREAVPHKVGINPVNPSDKFWRY